MIAQTDWETGATTYNVSAMDAAQIWRTAVALAATRARQALPESTTRIDKAQQLVLDGSVEVLDDHTARVTSQHDGVTRYFVVNGTCDCPDFARAPAGWCKHRVARALTVKAMQIAKTLGAAEGTITVTPEVTTPNTSEVAHPSTPTIPSQFLVTIQGKPFITFQGLLHLATQQGLLSLTEDVTHVTDHYVMATACATMGDGRVFRGVGDSTPDNVGARVKPHWRRMAGTRAKARALRDALNIAYVCAEELD
jgi:hypothetical protein